MVTILQTLMVSKTMSTQKKKDLKKDREKNQYQVSKDILNETIDEELKMISLERKITKRTRRVG